MDDLSEWLAVAYPGAYRTARLILRDPGEAEDAVQDAFLRAWRFRASAPRDAGWQPWLYRVVVNACCSRLRHDAPRRRTRADLDGDWSDESPGPEVAALHAESAGAIVAALADLPESLRIPVVLRYYAGLSEKDVAAAIGRRPGTVKSRLFEARRRLAADSRLRALALDEEASR